jgi:hypothetical protein
MAAAGRDPLANRDDGYPSAVVHLLVQVNQEGADCRERRQFPVGLVPQVNQTHESPAVSAV